MFAEEYGGVGAGALATLVAIEEVSKVCATSGLIIAVQELGSLGIKLAGTDEQKAPLPAAARDGRAARRLRADRGRRRAPTAARSAPRRARRRRVRPQRLASASSRTRASRTLYVVLREDRPARPGTRASSAFVVEADTPGFEVGRIEPKMGIKGSTTGELFFTDCRVPGREPARRGGRGLPPRDARARPLATRASPRRGSGSRRVRPTTRVEYARTRETFGKPIGRPPARRGNARRHGDEVRGGARPPLLAAAA